MRQARRRAFLAAAILPALLLFVVFLVVPTVNIFRISLYKWGGYSPDKTFVGFENFTKLWADSRFWQAFQNTVLLIVLVTIVTLSLSLFLAAVLTRGELRFRSFFRVTFYLPNILSIVVVAAVFSAIYDPNRGLLNTLLSVFRGEDAAPILWLGDQKIVLYSLAAALVWQALGYYMVMYMAAMSAVPVGLYEAAALEGASRVRQFFSVTLPLIWQTVRTTLTFFVISTINISFLLVRALTGGGPDGSTEVLLSYFYKQAYTNSAYGYGMAVGVVAFLFSFVLSALIDRLTRRDTVEL